MISKKTKYGLRALIHLAQQPKNEPVLISELATQEGIPKKFLEQILLDLKNHGILQSKKGKGGGYALSKAPSQIMMGQIVRILSGPLAPTLCVSQTAYQKCEECPDEKTCGVRIMMKEVRDAMASVLDRMSLAEVVRDIQMMKEGKDSPIMFCI